MRKISLVAVLALVIAGCGDSGDTAATEGTTQATTAETVAAAEADACPEAPFTGTIERTVESETGSGSHPVAFRSDGELVSAYAYYFGFGGTYTAYVGDFQIGEAGVGTDTLTAPSGGLLATIFIQSEEELEAGSVVEFSFVPIVDTGGGAEVNGFGADEVVGSVTVIAVTDDVICFDIDTSDPQQEIHGTVSAEITG
jgi:hypothetical protein